MYKTDAPPELPDTNKRVNLTQKLFDTNKKC